MNKYYIISLPNAALNAILEHCIQTSSSIRKSLDNTKVVVKLPVGAKVPNIIKSKKEYTNTEIKIELRKPEWTPSE